MTKKLILILLCFLMIVLPACAKDEPGQGEISSTEPEATYKGTLSELTLTLSVVTDDPGLSENEKEILRSWIENPLTKYGERTSGCIGLEELQGNVPILEGQWRSEMNRALGEKFGMLSYSSLPQTVTVLNEKVLFPESDGSFTYLVFAYQSVSDNTYLRKCFSATLSDETLTMTFQKGTPEAILPAIIEYFCILKVKADLFAM